VQDIRENTSADQAMKKIDEDLKKKLQHPPRVLRAVVRVGSTIEREAPAGLTPFRTVLVRRWHEKRIIDPDAERIARGKIQS
jgi:hypothetical protein